MKEWPKLLVTADFTILKVMKIINDSSYQFAMVVDDQKRLIGTITDGDIRRGLLKGLSTSDTVDQIMSKKFISFQEGVPLEQVVKTMHEQKIARIPKLNSEGQVIGVETIEELTEVKQKDNHVVLMVGGLGSRLGELTNDCPKPMLKVGGRPILETIIENFKDHGFRNFHLSVNYKSMVIEDYFGDGSRFNVSIKYLKEKEKLGTAGSLSLYEESNGHPIIVMNGDLLTKVNLSMLLETHEKNKYVATMCVRQYEYQVPYGVVKTKGQKIVKIEEKPIHSFFVNGGIYVLDPSVLKKINKNTHLDMPTFLQNLVDEKLPVGVFPVHEYWLDIGQKDDFDRAHVDFTEVFK